MRFSMALLVCIFVLSCSSFLRARRAGGDIRSPQRELWVRVGNCHPAREASDIIRRRRSISAQLKSPRWGFDS
jgi:hypothetical protein